MADETWMTAQEAVALGFADRTTNPDHGYRLRGCRDAAALSNTCRRPYAPARPCFFRFLTESLLCLMIPSSKVRRPPPSPIRSLRREVASDPPQAVVAEPVAAMMPVAVDTAALRAEILAAETTRRAAIRALLAPALLDRPWRTHLLGGVPG